MQIYACNIHEWEDLAGLELLSVERRQKLERYIQTKDKIRCLVGGLLLNYALGHNIPPRYTEYGKPYLENDLCFNISHAGDYVMLGTSMHPLGIDVEKTKPYSINVAKRCFTKAELDWLFEQDNVTAFYKLWTAKESIMKATGHGFNLSPSSFQVLPIHDGPHIIDTKKWYLYWHSFDGHEACIASASSLAQNNGISIISKAQVLQKITRENLQEY